VRRDPNGHRIPPTGGVRTMTNGLLKKDCFAETRLLLQPPGVNALLIMYNRFHNHVAKQLLEINENGRFGNPNDPDYKNPENEKQRDHDLFNIARL
jgi:linoleate 10R-lipoxygenase